MLVKENETHLETCSWTRGAETETLLQLCKQKIPRHFAKYLFRDHARS